MEIQKPQIVMASQMLKGVGAEAMIPTVDDAGWVLLGRLRTGVREMVQEYRRLEEDNVSGGGEEGAIIISQVDEKVMLALQLLRDAFKTGLKSKSTFFGGSSEALPLLRLFNDITLKSAFNEILDLPNEVDKLFESDPSHLEIAWIIMAMNDFALPQYLDVIRQNDGLAKKFYNPAESIVLSETKAAELVDVMHELEKVYFELDYQSYADFARHQEIMARIAPSLTSVNQSLSSMKLGSEEKIGRAVSTSPVPESNSDQCHQALSPLQPPSTGDTKSLRSRSDTSPRKSSPLKQSVSEEELTGRVGEDTHLSGSEHGETMEESLREAFKESSLENEQTVTSMTQTTETPQLSPETTLTTISSKESIHEEPAYIAANGTNELFGGLNLPDFVHSKASLLTNALGFFTPMKKHKELNGVMPGDFECVDREDEKERTRILSEDGKVELEICPIKGLAFQKFQCQKCHAVIGINDYPEAKLCDVSGYYFCTDCHKDDLTFSPARILKNWDFKKVSVAKSTYSIVGPQSRSELFDLEAINPHLFRYVTDLQQSKMVRLEIIKYSKVFLSCTEEGRLSVLQRVWPREHLLGSATLYTIEDLLEAHHERLAIELKEFLDLVQEHVTVDCQACILTFHRQ